MAIGGVVDLAGRAGLQARSSTSTLEPELHRKRGRAIAVHGRRSAATAGPDRADPVPQRFDAGYVEPETKRIDAQRGRLRDRVR